MICARNASSSLRGDPLLLLLFKHKFMACDAAVTISHELMAVGLADERLMWRLPHPLNPGENLLQE